MTYIKLPLNFLSVIKNNKPSYCSLEESIAQHIMIQITSRKGELVDKKDFGSDIWELEFNQLVKVYDWEEKVKKSVLQTIITYEKRLKDVDVSVHLSEVEDSLGEGKNSEIRRKADIGVRGIMKHSGEVFSFSTTVYVSPLSQ